MHHIIALTISTSTAMLNEPPLRRQACDGVRYLKGSERQRDSATSIHHRTFVLLFFLSYHSLTQQ